LLKVLAINLRESIWSLPPSGLAMLPDCVAYFECETIAVHPGGDHRIIVARIVNMQHHEVRDPLIFSRSQFMGAQPA
jgi:flavin reductase (DIM6/NTAB) family NADH-FMN oxidoreductase RutF